MHSIWPGLLQAILWLGLQVNVLKPDEGFEANLVSDQAFEPT